MHLLAVVVTVADLLALFACVGALVSCAWILPSSTRYQTAPELLVMRSRLWKILGWALLGLAATSAADLVVRAAGMSGAYLSELLPVLPTVVTRTHYGHVWLLRPAALAVLGLGWALPVQVRESRLLSAFLTMTCVLVAFARCASGHGADAGDLALPEWLDCLHVVGAALWGGSLVAVSAAVLPAALERCEERPALLADLSARFSTLAGTALAGVLVGGIYNAVRQVGTVRALSITPYGHTLAVKVSCVLVMIVLGASNRYLSVPLLQQWAGLPPGWRGPVLRLLRPLLSLGLRRPPGTWIATRFRSKVIAEAVLLLGVVLCTALLVQGVPAKHAVMSMPGGGMSHDLPPLSPQEIAALYRIRVETEPAHPLAGTKTLVTVFVDDASGRPVTTLEAHHERLIHFLVASENLEEFHHTHPEDFGLLTEEAKKQGRFSFPVTFGSGGRYGLAADFMDKGREGHWFTTIDVAGPRQLPTAWRLSRHRKADDLEADFAMSPDPLKAHVHAEYSFLLTQAGRPVTDLEPWLGALCHLAIFGEGLSSSAHEHGGDEAMARESDHMQMELSKYRGPRIYFGYEFPSPGRYRIFAQFARAGKVYTVPFDVEASP